MLKRILLLILAVVPAACGAGGPVATSTAAQPTLTPAPPTPQSAATRTGVQLNAPTDPLRPDGLYDIGSPTVLDLYVSPKGDDDNSGGTREQPLQTIGAAWNRIPPGELAATGYRINLLPGEYPCEGDCINFFSDRAGAYDFPIIITAADGPRTVTILGGLNIANVRYVYVLDLTLKAGGDAPTFGNNVFHCERCDHFLMRNVALVGPNPRFQPDNHQIQEVIKINQSQYVYLEHDDVSGTYQTGVDFFSVQRGHVLHNLIHDAGEWCMYFKGGSAYLRAEGNTLHDCGLGFQAGEGSNFEVMQSPFIHYESYDIKFVNNILYDIAGTGLSAVGSYNVLFAYNTLYKVGAFDDGSGRGYPLLYLAQGGRGCLDFSENGEGNAEQICGDLIAQGGWGTTALGYENGGEWIPNRNIFVYNNIFYNPPGFQTLYTHFYIRGPATPPATFSNTPAPTLADDNVQIHGNVIWNGTRDHLLGVEDPAQGCQPSNSACNAAQLRADNLINVIEPELNDPARGDFHPISDGNLFTFTTFSTPDFTWSDAPTRPPVPEGNLINVVPIDHDGNPRGDPGVAGAYVK